MQCSGMNNELTWDAIAHARKLHCVYPSSPPLASAYILIPIDVIPTHQNSAQTNVVSYSYSKHSYLYI